MKDECVEDLIRSMIENFLNMLVAEKKLQVFKIIGNTIFIRPDSKDSIKIELVMDFEKKTPLEIVRETKENITKILEKDYLKGTIIDMLPTDDQIKDAAWWNSSPDDTEGREHFVEGVKWAIEYIKTL